LKQEVFKPNQLDMESDFEQIFKHLFNDYQKLYHQKELSQLDKASASLYHKLLEKVKTASLQANDKETKNTKQWFMNKSKLIAFYKILDQKTDSLSMQN
jgi:hypothetical protein